MTVSSALLRGRTAARLLMRDAVTITRPGAPVFDPSSGSETPGTVTLYTGRADVKALVRQATQVQAGEREITVRTYDIKLLFGTVPASGGPRFKVNDLVTVTACEDPGLVGLTLYVIDPQHGGRRTATHLIAEDRS